MVDPVLVQRDGSVATVVLNRPESLNALSESSWRELGSRMRELSLESDLRCVILRGAGGKAFGAGADITEFPQVRADAALGRVYGELIHSTMQAIGECIHPTVAMIHGACVGGGLEVALMCDLRICGESSRFGIPINRLGLTMGYGELSGLLSVVGPAVALESCSKGEFSERRRRVKRDWCSAWWLTNPSRPRRARPPSASRRVPLWLRAGTSASSGVSLPRSNFPPPIGAKASPASTPRITAKDCAPS